jgi:hypothetical protein
VRPGQQENQFNNALMALSQALMLALLLEYMLLVALYQSWLQPIVLLVSVPLGLIGSLLALLISGNTINIFSIIGMIMAFGLVAKNGILLIDFTNLLRGQGVERTEALAQAARARLRPILMTSATMVFGMFPLAMKLGSGAESRAPMAVVVIGAIAMSTVLALIVIPAVYTLFDDLALAFSRRRAAARAAVPAVEAPTPMPAPVPVLEGDILFLTLPCITVARTAVTPEIMATMLAADNGVSTSSFQLYDAGDGKVTITLNNFCKLQEMGPDDEDDILSCVHFLLVDVLTARNLLSDLKA